MKKSFLPYVVFAVLLHYGCSSTVTFDQESVRYHIPLSETEEIIGTLASDDMKGRDTKSGGYYKAAAYVLTISRHIIFSLFILNIRTVSSQTVCCLTM